MKWNTESPEVASLISALHAHEDSDVAMRWLGTALSAETASSLAFALEYCQFSQEQAADGDTFVRWWNEHRSSMESVVRIRADARR